MPPVDAAVYRAALGSLIRAGHDAAAGRLAAAAPLVKDGIAGLTTVTASANAPKVPVGPRPPAARGGSVVSRA